MPIRIGRIRIGMALVADPTPDPDPAKLCRSERIRIRIRNTGNDGTLHILSVVPLLYPPTCQNMFKKSLTLFSS